MQATNQNAIVKFILNLARFFFFANYFYGICVIALSIEASLQQRFPLNAYSYYTLAFSATVIYYTFPYIKKTSGTSTNPRVIWYHKNQKNLVNSQLLLTFIFFGFTALFFLRYFQNVINIHWDELIYLFIFPVVAFLYYGIPINGLGKYNLRRYGWLKPFVIGFSWAGLVTVYPLIFYHLEMGSHYSITTQGFFLFLKNFMFIAMLGIIFDIKDYSDDKKLSLQTFVVKNGLFKTLFYVVMPLTILGLGTFIYYAETHHFHIGKILLNVIPFLLLMTISYSLKKPRSILYYFVVIDGLILIKAICGIIAITYF